MMEWFKKDKARYLIETKNLKRHYPAPQTRMVINNGKVLIFHKVKGRFNQYTIRVVYPRNFPYSKKWQVAVVKPKFRGAPHQFESGGLCLFKEGEVGPQTSGKQIVDWAREWVKAYEIWKDTGKFPKFKGR